METVSSTAVASAQEKEPVTFMDIPPEIRLRIFGYLFEEEEPIRVQIKTQQHQRIVVRRGAQRKATLYHYQVYNKDSDQWTDVDEPPKRTAILCVNKQLYAESSAVLYGSNTFSLASTTALRDFGRTIGRRIEFLRSIIIEPRGYIKSTAKSALDLLQRAKGLRHLQFDHHDICEGPRGNPILPKMVAEDCKDLVRSLKSSYEDEKLKGSVLDVVTVKLTNGSSPPQFHGVAWSCGCVDMDSGDLRGQVKNEKFNKQIRDLIAGYVEVKKGVARKIIKTGDSTQAAKEEMDSGEEEDAMEDSADDMDVPDIGRWM